MPNILDEICRQEWFQLKAKTPSAATALDQAVL